MNTFEVCPGFVIACTYVKTRAFRHDAVLLVDGCEVDRTKCCYQNRTWESYTFQSVMKRLVEKTKCMIEEQKTVARAWLKHGPRSNPFAGVAAVAAIGNLLCDTPKDANDWKARMLKAGMPGLELPPDWDTLDESEKQRRLDAVINIAKEPL